MNSEILSPSGKGNDTTENFRGISSCVGPKTVPRVAPSPLHSSSLSVHGSTRPLPPRRKSEVQRYDFPRYKIKVFLLWSRGSRPPAPGRFAAPSHGRDVGLLLNGARETGPRPPDPRRSRRDHCAHCCSFGGFFGNQLECSSGRHSSPTLLFSPLPLRWGVKENALAAVGVGRSACQGVRSRAFWDDLLVVLRLIVIFIFSLC